MHPRLKVATGRSLQIHAFRARHVASVENRPSGFKISGGLTLNLAAAIVNISSSQISKFAVAKPTLKLAAARPSQIISFFLFFSHGQRRLISVGSRPTLI
jgi:hypothetical protein